jgi:hypothetical protein
VSTSRLASVEGVQSDCRQNYGLVVAMGSACIYGEKAGSFFVSVAA